jgi:hypothetical protein
MRFRRALGYTPKRTVLAGLSVILALVATAEVLSRPDPARVKQEEYDVLSAYLFRIPLYPRPLPVQCAEDPRYTGGVGGLAEIHRYFVWEQTISTLSQPSTFVPIVERKIRAPETPIAVLNNWFLRNLSSEQFVQGFSGGGREKRLALVQGEADKTSEQPTLVVRFTKVGFNHDFTMAMLYAEVSCGATSSREYAYLAKEENRGRRAWYVFRVDPPMWNTLVLEQDPGPGTRTIIVKEVLFWLLCSVGAIWVVRRIVRKLSCGG